MEIWSIDDREGGYDLVQVREGLRGPVSLPRSWLAVTYASVNTATQFRATIQSCVDTAMDEEITSKVSGRDVVTGYKDAD